MLLSISFSPSLPLPPSIPSLPPYLSTSLPPYLSTSLPPYLSTSLSPYLSTSLPLCLSTSLPLYLSASPPLCLSTSLPLHLSASLPLYLSTSLPLYPSLNHCSLLCVTDFYMSPSGERLTNRTEVFNQAGREVVPAAKSKAPSSKAPSSPKVPKPSKPLNLLAPPNGERQSARNAAARGAEFDDSDEEECDEQMIAPSLEDLVSDTLLPPDQRDARNAVYPTVTLCFGGAKYRHAR